MADQPNVFNTLINPIMVQEYERYLPTAFDEGMTLLEKVNKIILSLNRIGKLSNDVLSQWNQVMDWVMADGLDASIDSKIDAMLADGSLATVIGNAITDLGNEMGNLADLTTTNKTSLVSAINGLESDITTFETNTNTSMTNFQNTINAKLYYDTPENHGAKGDGVTDDTDAIQACLNASVITAFSPKTYIVSKTLTLPKNHSIEGNHAELRVNSFTPNNLGASLPVNTILYVQNRDAVYQSELDGTKSFVKDLRIRGTAGLNLTGMYLGVTDRALVTQGTSVNFSVMGYNFSNISITQVNDGLVLGECWSSNFNNVTTSYITNNACSIIGQSVNNNFLGCQFDTAGQGNQSLYINNASYNGSVRRPEGNTFVGGFIGQSKIGILIESCLTTKFTSVIVDLNTDQAFLGGVNIEDVVFSDCYLYSSGGVVANYRDSTSDFCFSAFRNCNFIPAGASTQTSIVASNQVVIFDGCEITSTITFASTAKGSVINNIWNEISNSNPRVIKNGANVYTNNNMFKLDGSAITVS